VATFDATIMGGDAQRDLERKFIEVCGLNYGDYLENRKIVTREIFEKNFDKIVNYIHRSRDNCLAYQVLGYFILFTGSKLPKNEKNHILDCSNFEAERGFWIQNPKLEKEREFFLHDFRQKIINHTPGQLIELKNIFEESL